MFERLTREAKSPLFWFVPSGEGQGYIHTHTSELPSDSCEGVGVCCYYGVFVHLGLEP